MSAAARILIVDDSRIFRAALEDALGRQDDIVVAGSVFSGTKALEFLREHPPDIVTLDVEMPGLNGLDTLQAIQQFNRSRPADAEVGVLMLSSFTKRGAEVTVQALQAGAFDVVTKPSSTSAEASRAALRSELLPKIRAFLARRQRAAGKSIDWNLVPRSAHQRAESLPPASHARSVRAVLIGASTGGPQALMTLLPDLAQRITAPILVVQHMPAGFTQSLAESLARRCPCPVVEAEDGQAIVPRTIYIAPGGKHLVLRSSPRGELMAGLNEQPPESGCRPSASVLFRSAAAILGRESVAIIMTGMGNDGTAGLAPLKRAGGYIVAQDEESSVVWGMPGSAVEAGLTDMVVPLGDIAKAVDAVVIGRGRP